MKIIKNLEELKHSEVSYLFKELLESEKEYEEALLKTKENPETFFMEYLGGYIHILSSLDEVSKIDTGLYNDVEDRFFNLSELSDSFDICRWTEDRQFLEIMMVTSNSGGSIYFIPKQLALQHTYLMESLNKSFDNSL